MQGSVAATAAVAAAPAAASTFLLPGPRPGAILGNGRPAGSVRDLRQLAKVIEGEDSAGVAVGPVHLEGVISHLPNGLRADILANLAWMEDLGPRKLIDAIGATAGTA